jgi:hypothetical protein
MCLKTFLYCKIYLWKMFGRFVSVWSVSRWSAERSPNLNKTSNPRDDNTRACTVCTCDFEGWIRIRIRDRIRPFKNKKICFIFVKLYFKVDQSVSDYKHFLVENSVNAYEVLLQSYYVQYIKICNPDTEWPKVESGSGLNHCGSTTLL